MSSHCRFFYHKNTVICRFSKVFCGKPAVFPKLRLAGEACVGRGCFCQGCLLFDVSCNGACAPALLFLRSCGALTADALVSSRPPPPNNEMTYATPTTRAERAGSGIGRRAKLHYPGYDSGGLDAVEAWVAADAARLVAEHRTWTALQSIDLDILVGARVVG